MFCSVFVLRRASDLTFRMKSELLFWNTTSSVSVSALKHRQKRSNQVAGGQVQHCASRISEAGCCGNVTPAGGRGGGRAGLAGSLNWTGAGRKSRKTTGAIPGCTSSFVAAMRLTKRMNSLQICRLTPNYVFSWREIKVRRRDFVEHIAASH